MAFEDLYQEIILDHYKDPRNFGETIEHTCKPVELDNPVCGDHIKLLLYVNDSNVVEEIRFSGAGCAISVASASMMTEQVKGKTVEQAKHILNDVLETIRGEKDPDVLDEYGDVTAIKGVTKFPIRVKCATLAWHALEKALKQTV